MRNLPVQRWIGRSLLVLALAVGLGCPADNGTQPGTLTLSVNPTNATVLQGGSTPIAATATSGGGFSGAVTFAVTGAPAGVTVAVTNITTTGTTTTATVTLQVAASTAAGVHNLTVRAQGSGVADGTAAFTLTVTAIPDYALSLAPAALTINQSATGTSTVTITRTNFTDAVTLSLAGAPAGVTGAFAPAAPTGTTSTLTVTVGAAVAVGTYNLTVNGTGTPGNRSTALTLTVAAAPNYALSAAPAALTIVEGGNSTSTITITRTNFTGAVTLSLGNAPPGVTGSFAPAAPTGTTSTLTLSVGLGVAPGLYNLTVDGTGAPGNRSAALALTVTALPPDFSLSIAPAALTIVQGGSDNTAVTISRTNFTGAVTLGINTAPGGVSGTFAPGSTTGTTSTLTVNVGAAVPPGLYQVEVAGNGTPGVRSTILSLTVVAAPDYTLSLAPAALTINQGVQGTSTVTITRTNFPGAVTLSLGGAPAGVTGAFVPAAPTGTTSALTVTVALTVPPGIYNLTVDGTGTAGSRSTPLTLTVTDAPSYALSLAPTALTIVQGGNDNTTVTITRTNFTGTVTLSVGGAPAGVTGAFVPPSPTGTSSALTVTVGAAVAPGTYNLTVDGTGAAGDRTTPLTLTVTAAPNYSLSLAPTSLTIQQGANDVSTVTITRTNFTGAVTLSLGGAPGGMTGAFAPAAPTGTSSVLTVTVGGAVAVGTYNLTVDGTGTAGSRSTPLTVTVTATPNYTLSASPSSLTIAQNANANTTVTLARTNFTGAVTLSLGGAPAGVTGSFAPAAPTGTTSTLTVSVGPAVAASTYNLTIDGTGTPGSRSTPLSLTVTGGGGGNNVTVSFANCPVADRAVWLASQDGNGAWTRVIGAGDVYTFGVASGTGGVAWVVLGAGNESSVQVQYMTQAELTAGTLDFCGGAVPTTRTFTGTATNFGITGMAFVSLGGGVGVANFAQPGLTITGVSDGTHDLVGFMSDLVTPGLERGLLRRDIVVSADGTVGTVDFTGGESFAAASANISILGLSGGETIFQNLAYRVGATCQAAPLGLGGTGAASFTAYGIPAGPQRVSDFHQIAIIASTGTNVRTINESFHTFGARTVTLGASLAAPTVTSLGGPYKRLQAIFTVPGEYGGPSFFGYVDASTDKTVNLGASAAYRGGPGLTLALADFSAVAGWDNNWAPASAASGDWNVGASGGTAGSLCVENATQRSAARGGTF